MPESIPTEYTQCDVCPNRRRGPFTPKLTGKLVLKTLNERIFLKALGAEEPIFMGRPIAPGSMIFQASMSEHLQARDAKGCAEKIENGACTGYTFDDQQRTLNVIEESTQGETND